MEVDITSITMHEGATIALALVVVGGIITIITYIRRIKKSGNKKSSGERVGNNQGTQLNNINSGENERETIEPTINHSEGEQTGEIGISGEKSEKTPKQRKKRRGLSNFKQSWLNNC